MSVVHILGAGSAYPKSQISNPFLDDLGCKLDWARFESEAGIITRHTSLPLDYIVSTRNTHPAQALSACAESVTTLGQQAAMQAVKRAGIAVSDIGLVLAETCTPRQTCPGESHRVAKALGLRAKAYDLIGAGASFGYFLDVISKWKPQNQPRYILCVSSHTPTQSINYGQFDESVARFGDGASAIIVSMQETGRLELGDSCLLPDDEPNSCSLEIDTLGFIRCNSAEYAKLLERQAEKALCHAQKSHDLETKTLLFCGPQYDLGLLRRISERMGIDEERLLSNLKTCGDTLSASFGCVLADNWERLPQNCQVLVSIAGTGFSCGYLIFRVC